MVGAGMGLTLVPALALAGARSETGPVVVRPFVRPGPTRRMALCWRRTHPRGSDHVRLAAFLASNLPPGVAKLGTD